MDGGRVPALDGLPASAAQPVCRKPFRLCTILSWLVADMESVIKREISGAANGSPEGIWRHYEAILRLSEALRGVKSRKI